MMAVWGICIAAFAFSVWRWQKWSYIAPVAAMFITPTLSHVDSMDGIFAVYPFVIGAPAILFIALSGEQPALGLAAFLMYAVIPYLLVTALTYGAIATWQRGKRP